MLTSTVHTAFGSERRQQRRHMACRNPQSKPLVDGEATHFAPIFELLSSTKHYLFIKHIYILGIYILEGFSWEARITASCTLSFGLCECGRADRWGSPWRKLGSDVLT